MSEAIKSISLDDIGESPVDVRSPAAEKTRNKALHYSPQYDPGAGEGAMPVTNQGPGGGDFEDYDGTHAQAKGMFGATLTRFSQIIPVNFGQGNKSNPLLLVFGVVFAVGVAVAYIGTDEILSMLGLAEEVPYEEPAPEPAPTTAPAAEAAPAPVEAPVMSAATRAAEEIPGNPYWKLPNPVTPVAPGETELGGVEIDSLTAGLQHPFTYQRYKTVEELRKSKSNGSAAILYDALTQPKLWTRMSALQGLAEQGLSLDTESTRAAIGDARSDLVRNYFRRFNKVYTPAIGHMMRQSLRVVDGKARMIIVNSLSQHRDGTNDMYLLAAEKDSDGAIVQLAARLLRERPVGAEARMAYEQAITGESVVEVITQNSAKTKPSLDIKVEKIPNNMNVEEVYFHSDEPAPAAATDQPVPVKTQDDGFNDIGHTPAK